MGRVSAKLLCHWFATDVFERLNDLSFVQTHVRQDTVVCWTPKVLMLFDVLKAVVNNWTTFETGLSTFFSFLFFLSFFLHVSLPLSTVSSR
jgi:hypothetical protein